MIFTACVSIYTGNVPHSPQRVHYKRLFVAKFCIATIRQNTEVYFSGIRSLSLDLAKMFPLVN